MKVYHRELPLEQGLVVPPKDETLVPGYKVSCASGIRLFRHLAEKGQPIKCWKCGIQAEFWIAGSDNAGRRNHHVRDPVLNLYGFGVHVQKKTGELIKRIVMMTRDHIIPKSFGGIDVVGNLRPACEDCNSQRGSKMTKEELAFMKAHPEFIDPTRAENGRKSREHQAKVEAKMRLIKAERLAAKLLEEPA